MRRREFLQMLGVLSSTTLMSSCGSERDQKELISYLVPPEDGVRPGAERWLPGTCTECPAGCGMLVRLREERAVKLEGLSGHPVSSGGLCMRGQASLWRRHHPERYRKPLLRNDRDELEPIAWEKAFRLILEALARERAAGRTNVFLAGRTTGSLSRLIDNFCRRLTVERAPEFEFFPHAALRQAYGRLFHRPDLPHYRLEKADVLVTVGADMLETFVSPVDFAAQQARAAARPAFHWTHLEPHMSLTGANAGRRLTLTPGSEPFLLRYLLAGLIETPSRSGRLPERLRRAAAGFSRSRAADLTGLSEESLAELLQRLQQAENPLLVVGGVSLAHEGGEAAALLAGVIQWATGMIGRTVDFSRTENYAGVGDFNDLQHLARRLNQGEVGVLFVSRTDPVFQAPAGFGFDQGLDRAGLTVGLADLPDATSRRLDLILPRAHGIESWGDLEPRTGIYGLLQPAVPPLAGSRPEGDILTGLLAAGGEDAGKTIPSYYEWLRQQWQERFSPAQLEAFLARGYHSAGLAADAPGFAPEAAIALLEGDPPPAGLKKPLVVMTPSLRTFDGRSTPIPLLSEVPDPLTTISYGPWVSVGPAAAGRLELEDGDLAECTSGGWSGRLPVKIQPGLPDAVGSLPRENLVGAPPGSVAATGEPLLYLEELTMVKRPGPGRLPILAGSPSQHGRGLIPEPVERRAHGRRPNLYPPPEHEDYRWGMAIDLARCIGCGACAASCYIENNVPLAGREDHLRGREMSWLRIEPFYRSDGRVEFLPMLCQHCHYAPCEPVCPVYAAYHNPEGLNVQVYDRCVGTRYCSNNCPYKVRRFNWWEYRREPPLPEMLNPDLSVRSRGMMEKCTFCIQRLRRAKDTAKDENRRVRDGEVTTACAQSCPTGAIVFGNLLDDGSRVAVMARDDRAYRVFEELGTASSIYYLGRNGKERG